MGGKFKNITGGRGDVVMSAIVLIIIKMHRWVRGGVSTPQQETTRCFLCDKVTGT